jgi:hypothetical protein
MSHVDQLLCNYRESSNYKAAIAKYRLRKMHISTVTNENSITGRDMP